MKKVKYRFVELVAELDKRDILLTTDGQKVFFEVPKGTMWEDMHESILAYKQALIDLAGQRAS